MLISLVLLAEVGSSETVVLFRICVLTQKSSLYSRYYAEAGDEWWGPPPRRSAWTTWKRSGGGDSLASVSYLTGPGIEHQTSRADSDIF